MKPSGFGIIELFRNNHTSGGSSYKYFCTQNRTHSHIKNPYKAHKYRLCRDLPFYSNSISATIYCV